MPNLRPSYSWTSSLRGEIVVTWARYRVTWARLYSKRKVRKTRLRRRWKEEFGHTD
jgi:hypothetical protein